MKPYKQSAGIFIPCFIFLLTASSLSILLLIIKKHISDLQIEEIKYYKNKEGELGKIANLILTNQHNKLGALNCYKSEVSLCLRDNRNYAMLMAQDEITYINLANRFAFPRIDFESLLKDTSNCTSLVPHSGRSTSFGAPLSLSSSYWPQTHVFENDKILTDLRCAANIASNFNISINGGTIATPGFMHFASSLNVAGRLIIAAAGDIIINHLNAEVDTDVTAVSTGGLISIASLSGNPRMRLISKYGHFVNGKFSKQIDPLMPPLKEIQIVSLQ